MTDLELTKRWRSVKDRTPVIGIDDGGFSRFSKENREIPVYGVIMKGSSYVDGVIQCHIERDEPNVNMKIKNMIERSSHKAQLKAMFFQGITIGGFGVLDIEGMYAETNIPVIVILRKYPDYTKIRSALKKIFPNDDKRWNHILRAGTPLEVQKDPLILIQVSGIHPKDAFLLVQKCAVVGTIPEALRIAHFIGASNYRYSISSVI
ncbi:MAG: endonuclease dU [Candidatus Hodarchaeales archaeon]|jgi:endonuclease V-like protein UPF0215 family